MSNSLLSLIEFGTVTSKDDFPPARAPGTRQLLLTFFLWVPVCNRVGEDFCPLLAARPVRHFSGILPLHGPAHKKAPE